jgi:hypothetical protein
MSQSSRPLLIAIDLDGPVLSCIAHGEHSSRSVLEVSSAIELRVPNPPGVTVYETDRRRFVVRAQTSISSEVEMDVAARRVRQVDAALRIGAAGPQPSVLVASIPLQNYFQSEGQASEAVQEMELKLAEAVTRHPAPTAMNISRFKLVPRTVGAFMDWAFDDQGMPRDAGGVQQLVIVDVGMAATSVVAFDATTHAIDHGLMETHADGLAQPLAEVARFLSSAHGVEAPPGNALLQAVADGIYRYRGRSFSITGALQPLLSTHAEWVFALISDRAPTAQVVVVGIGAKPVAELLAGKGLTVRVPGTPEHANARGMAKFAVLVWKEGL